MNKFLTFETTALKLNNSVFPCDSVSFDVQADTVNVYDIDGNFLYTSPNSPLQGQVSTQFYLTGALPNFLKLEHQSETPTRIQFNDFFIPSAHLSNLSFSVAPFQPIAVSVSFVFYHGLSVLDMNHKDHHSTYSSSLATSNGLTSYIVTTNRATYPENPNNFIVTDFNYSFTVDRQPVLRVRENVPSRVAMKQITAEMEVGANNLDGRLKIYGTNAVFDAVLKDSQNPSISSNLSFTGIINSQQYSISDTNYGLSKIKLTNTFNRKRVLLSIPFEEENHSLLYATPTTVETPEIPIEDLPVSPPDPPPPIIVNGNIPNENVYQVVILFKFPFTSVNGAFQQTQPCNDENAYGDPLSSIASFDINGYRFNFSPKEEGVRYTIQPSYDDLAGLGEYEKEYRSPQYYVGTFSFNQNFLDYINEEVSLTESFPTIPAVDDYENSTNVVFYLFSHGYSMNEGVCETQPRVLHYVTWDQLFSKLATAIAGPNLGNGTTEPYIVKFGFGA